MKIESYKKNGKTYYKFRISLGTDPSTGKQLKIRRSGFVSRLEAEKAYIKLREEAPRMARSNPTFEDVFKRLLDIKKFSSKESTLIKLDNLYKNHFKATLGGLKISTINSSMLQDTLIQLYSTYTSAHKMFSVVEQVFALAYRERLILENPCDFITKPKLKNKIKTDNFYTKDELNLFLEEAKKQLSHQWYVFFHLLAFSGIRRGEALALFWSDLNDNVLSINKTITFTSAGFAVDDTPKTNESNREILLDPITVDLLNSLEHESKFIFSNSKGSFITSSQPIRQLHKIKNIRYISPHGFRHTHCSLLFSAGASLSEVQERLGHKDIKTTLQIYNHVYKEDKQSALDKFITFMK